MCKQMDNPLITVVIPVYNVENYIGKCIESLQAQTLKEMVEEYEKVNGMYISALDFCKISQTNYVVYYYQLRNFFVRNIFKEHKTV